MLKKLEIQENHISSIKKDNFEGNLKNVLNIIAIIHKVHILKN